MAGFFVYSLISVGVRFDRVNTDIYNNVIVAYKQISSFVRKTPFIYSPTFSNDLGCEVFFKLENLQITGSFKVRGAVNKLLSLAEEEKSKGVISASTGNHGAAVAYGSQKLGIPATIYVPEDASHAKLDNMKLYGANIEFYGSDCVESEKKGREDSLANSKEYISPYNDLSVIAGQGTIGLEMEQQAEDLDSVVVSVGGGGLISGVSAYLKKKNPSIRIIGCSPKNSAVMIHSMDQGKILDLESSPTLSDGTAGGVEKGSITFNLCCGLIDQTVLVEESEIIDSMVKYMSLEHQLIEGAAGTAVAALRKIKNNIKGQRVGVIICGSNISLGTLKDIL